MSVILEDLYHLNILSMHLRKRYKLTELMIGYKKVEDTVLIKRINICDKH